MWLGFAGMQNMLGGFSIDGDAFVGGMVLSEPFGYKNLESSS